MKNVNSLITQFCIEALKRCTPIQVEALQAWLRALADYLPAMQRDPEKFTLSDIGHYVEFTKAQKRAQVKVYTADGDFPSENMSFSMSNIDGSKTRYIKIRGDTMKLELVTTVRYEDDK